MTSFVRTGLAYAAAAALAVAVLMMVSVAVADLPPLGAECRPGRMLFAILAATAAAGVGIAIGWWQKRRS